MNRETSNLENRAPGFQNGFTLLEVLVASALFIILLTLLLAVISNTTAIASKASEQIDSTRIARESLDLIGRDISQISLPWSRTNTNSLQFVVNPVGMGQFTNRDAMFWQAPLLRESTNNTNGNLAMVGYFVLRDLQANPRDSRFQLRRVYVDPKTTNGDYRIYSNPSNWLPNLTNFAPATAAADKANAQKGWVADGVLGIWVRSLDRSGNLLTNSTNFNSRSATFGRTNAMVNPYPTNSPYTRLPAFVEVTLVCVAPREIVKINSLPSPTNMTTFADQVRAANPGVKSVTSFSRKFQLLTSD